jgi:periplasmic copper chaperone A
MMSFTRILALSLTLALPWGAARADTMPAPAAAAHLGPLVLTGGFSRATLPNAPVAGGFFTVENTGAEDDRLIAARSAVAGHMEVHEMRMQGDVMKMHELEGGLPIPAGKTVTLKPGGYHVMFIDLQQPLVEGSTVMVTLVFEKAGEIALPLAVGPSNAKSMPGMDAAGKMHDAMPGHEAPTGHGAMTAPMAMPDHTAPAGFDQAGITGDAARIDGLLRSMFETPGNALMLDPVLIEGDVAVVGWVQGDRGGRALLERADTGLWRVALCAGDGLKGAENMRALGLRAETAARLAAAQEVAEAALPSETRAKFAAFGEAVRFDQGQ